MNSRFKNFGVLEWGRGGVQVLNQGAPLVARSGKWNLGTYYFEIPGERDECWGKEFLVVAGPQAGPPSRAPKVLQHSWLSIFKQGAPLVPALSESFTSHCMSGLQILRCPQNREMGYALECILYEFAFPS